MISVVTYEDRHFEAVASLWREAFPHDPPWNAPEVAIPEKLKTQRELFLVAVDSRQVVGSVMAGYDGHRGWISRIAVLRAHQGKGIGQTLLTHAETGLAKLGCIKVNLQVVTANGATTAFYQKSGYAVEERISMSKLLARR